MEHNRIREPGQRAFSSEMWDVIAYSFAQKSDGEIARAIGVTTPAVQRQRTSRGIAPFEESYAHA